MPSIITKGPTIFENLSGQKSVEEEKKEEE